MPGAPGFPTPAPPVTATTTRSRASQVSVILLSARYFSSAASTWSASHSSASSRSAVRLPAPEVVGQRGVDALGCVDVAVGEPAPQRFRRDVDQLDLVGGAHDLVGHLLLLLDAGDLGDDVVEAFQVLDVDRRDHGDAGVEQLLDVLPAFGVLAARGVGVGELVDQHHLRAAAAAPPRRRVRRTCCRGTRCSCGGMTSMPVEQLGGLLAAVRLDDRGDQIGAALQPAVRLAEHREGLADAGSCAEVDAQLPALLLVRAVGKRRIGCSHAHHPPDASALCRILLVQFHVELQHVDPGLAEEAEHAAVRCCPATACRTWSGLTPRALATRFTCRSA